MVESAATADSDAAPKWKEDKTASVCSECERKFSVKVRRHRCRHCGQVFCGACCKSKMPIPHLSISKAVRVCANCADTLRTTESATIAFEVPSSLAAVNVTADMAAAKAAPEPEPAPLDDGGFSIGDDVTTAGMKSQPDGTEGVVSGEFDGGSGRWGVTISGTVVGIKPANLGLKVSADDDMAMLQ